MGLLQESKTESGYLKAGFQGFAGTGKSHTAALLAVGTRKAMGLDGPIAFFDTEGGATYLQARVRTETGKPMLSVASRSLDDLLAVGKEAIESKASVLIVDSVTHIWRDVCDCYLAQVNAVRKAKNLPGRTALEFQDWNPIKAKWAKWTDFFLNSPLHVVICGRGGFEYDYETDEETGKKTLVKTGTKMKAEGEFGFEPSLGVEMERIQNLDTSDGSQRVVRRATIIKDRFSLIDGRSCDNPTFDFFWPHVQQLIGGAHVPVDTTLKTDVGVDGDGNDSWAREKRERAILAEEIQGELLRAWPSQGADDKAAKTKALFDIFNTRSWTKVETMQSEKLRDGLIRLRELTTPVATAREVAVTTDKGAQ